MRSHLAAVWLVVACSSERAPPRSPPPPDTPPVSRVAPPMPRLAGIILEPRMQRHAAQLAALDSAVAAHDCPRVGVAARAILAEPRLARPSPDVGLTMNDEVPAAFFALQDRFLADTRAVDLAARACDHAAIGVASDALRSTCDACHALYREPSRR